MGILGKIAGSKDKQTNPDDFLDLDLSGYSLDSNVGSSLTAMKFADVSSTDDVPVLRQVIYDGNSLIADISSIVSDEFESSRVLKDLKSAVNDVDGDIIAINKTQLLATPRGMKIDREKVVESNYK